MKNLKKLLTLVLIATISFSMVTYAKAEEVEDEVTSMSEDTDYDSGYEGSDYDDNDSDSSDDDDDDDNYYNETVDKNTKALEALNSSIESFINSKSKVKVYSKTKIKSKEVIKYIYNVKAQTLTGKIKGKYTTVKLTTKEFVKGYITDSVNLKEVLNRDNVINTTDNGSTIKTKLFNAEASRLESHYDKRRYGYSYTAFTAYRIITGSKAGNGLKVTNLKAASYNLVTAFDYTFKYVD
jgi:hypothetical protein